MCGEPSQAALSSGGPQGALVEAGGPGALALPAMWEEA